MMKKMIWLALMLSLCLSGTALAEQIVIVNKGVSESVVDADTLKRIYLGKQTAWNNGEKIVPVTLNKGQVHQEFVKNILNKSTAQFTLYWKQMIFTGQGLPPKSFESEADVVNFVSGVPGAIGYIDRATPHGGVRVVQTK
jgi:ABC-type phosphate transport system substrate-binding protein